MIELAIAALLTFAVTVLATPKWIKRAHSKGLVGKDMNKHDKPKVAETGGIIVFLAFLLGMGVVLASLIASGNIELVLITSASLVSLSIIVTIAYIDDVSGWKRGFVRWKKPLITIIAVLPLIPFLLDRMAISLLGIPIELPFLFYPLIMVPIGFIVATNAVNLLGGFNGLETIMAMIGIATLMWFTQGTLFFQILLVAFAGLGGFLLFNHFPARVFPGDTLTYFVGALFAVVAVLGNFQSITILIMTPYIIEGFIKSREIHYIYKNKKIFKPECFGIPSKDNSLKTPYPQIWSLTHVAMKAVNRMKGIVYENDVTMLMTGIYALWCLGLIWFFG
jgi:UDP-N-acetylglucosamine--dolichyl-phosphate N-acetylglucosaminephosphotransferase